MHASCDNDLAADIEEEVRQPTQLSDWDWRDGGPVHLLLAYDLVEQWIYEVKKI